MKIKHLSCYEATIKYIEPVKPDSLPDGTRTLFQAGWYIDEDDSERWQGNWAMIPFSPSYWVPSCELVDIKEIDPQMYYDARKKKYNLIDLEPEVAKIIDENFWDLL